MYIYSLFSLSGHLEQGSVVVMPTDTVYGLAASAKDPQAVEAMYAVKGRKGKPGTLLAANVEQIVDMGINRKRVLHASKHWPGPVSVVMPAPDSLAYLHFGLNSLAWRIPKDKFLLELLELTGPLATTSANLPGQPVATSIKQAKNIFGSKIKTYIDGGQLNSQPSQVLILKKDNNFKRLR